jgi:hypothetical protein
LLAVPVLAAVGAGVGLAALAAVIVMFSRKQGIA